MCDACHTKDNKRYPSSRKLTKCADCHDKYIKDPFIDDPFLSGDDQSINIIIECSDNCRDNSTFIKSILEKGLGKVDFVITKDKPDITLKCVLNIREVRDGSIVPSMKIRLFYGTCRLSIEHKGGRTYSVFIPSKVWSGKLVEVIKNDILLYLTGAALKASKVHFADSGNKGTK